MNLFIVLEGIDRSGKTTVCSILKDRLGGSSLIGFPDRNTEIGKTIDRFLKKEIALPDPAIHLLFSANRYEKEKDIHRLLEQGDIICDRYWLSGALYSTAKGLDYDWCKDTDKFLLKPDITFFLDTPVSITKERSSFGEEVHDRAEFQQRVYKLYKEKANEEGVIVVDGSLPIESVVEDIMSYIEKIKNQKAKLC